MILIKIDEKEDSSSNSKLISEISKENINKIHKLYQVSRIGCTLKENVRHKTVGSGHIKSAQKIQNYNKILSLMKLSKPKRISKIKNQHLNESSDASPYRFTSTYNEIVSKYNDSKSQSQLRKHMIVNLERNKLIDNSNSSNWVKRNTRNYAAETNSTCEQSDRIKSKICKIGLKSNFKVNRKFAKFRNEKLKTNEFMIKNISKSSFSQTTSNLKVRMENFDNNSYQSYDTWQKSQIKQNKYMINKKKKQHENWTEKYWNFTFYNSKSKSKENDTSCIKKVRSKS